MVSTSFDATLASGLDVISESQVITFTKYVRVVLPADGFVFWVKADIVSPSALANASMLNASFRNNGAVQGVTLNTPPVIVTAAPTTNVIGSLHYMTANTQDEAAFQSTNRVRFTAEAEIQDLNQIGPAVLFLGSFDGRTFAFSQRGSYYQQSGLHHYLGDAVTATMRTQIIDDPRYLDLLNPVVSNSLPLWLELTSFFPMWPSFLVPQNEPPPYCAVHIDPDGTEALQDFPALDATGGQSQLVQDVVRLTFYGVRHQTVMDFMQYVFQYSANTDNFGVMDYLPVVRDGKVTAAELGTIAQMKTTEFKISYYQSRVRDVARKAITAVGGVTFNVNAPQPVPPAQSANVSYVLRETAL